MYQIIGWHTTSKGWRSLWVIDTFTIINLEIEFATCQLLSYFVRYFKHLIFINTLVVACQRMSWNRLVHLRQVVVSPAADISWMARDFCLAVESESEEKVWEKFIFNADVSRTGIKLLNLDLECNRQVKNLDSFSCTHLCEVDFIHVYTCCRFCCWSVKGSFLPGEGSRRWGVLLWGRGEGSGEGSALIGPFFSQSPSSYKLYHCGLLLR